MSGGEGQEVFQEAADFPRGAGSGGGLGIFLPQEVLAQSPPLQSSRLPKGPRLARVGHIDLSV